MNESQILPAQVAGTHCRRGDSKLWYLELIQVLLAHTTILPSGEKEGVLSWNVNKSPPKKRGKLFIFIILEYKQMSPEDTSLYISGFQGLCYSNIPLGLKIWTMQIHENIYKELYVPKYFTFKSCLQGRPSLNPFSFCIKRWYHETIVT